jgi:alpha-galactosidase
MRIGEMEESIKIIKQALEQIEEGPVLAKVPRLIKPPKGDIYHQIEGSKGTLGYYLVSDGCDKPYRIHGNVMNTGLIANLPQNAVVEVPCLVDGNGITPCYVGNLPEQCAALNRTNINMQILTIEAALTRKKEHIYHAAMLDPHTSAELSIDDIISLCDDLIEAHGDYLPKYK